MRETGSNMPGNGRPGEASITISGTVDEINAVRQMMSGMIWLSYKNSGDGQEKLELTSRFMPLPEPIEDPLVPPQWQSEIGLGDIPAKWAPPVREMCPLAKEGWHQPSFYMSHIFEPKVNIPKLQSWGFECMRSRRGEDGKFWEVWYLPGEWSARGGLREFIDGVKADHQKTHFAPGDCIRCQFDWRNFRGEREHDSIDHCRKHDHCPYGACEEFKESAGLPDLPWSKRAEMICRWLAQHVCFGSLNVSVQRMALVIDD